MTVRAKFRVTRIERTLGSRKTGEKVEGRDVYGQAETRTVILVPVYANNDPAHENSKFWDATPTGEIKLGIVNLEASEQFELEHEYYVDFTPV